MADTGYELNMENMEDHKLVEERHYNLVVKFSYLRYLDDVDLFNTSGADEGKEGEQGK